MIKRKGRAAARTNGHGLEVTHKISRDGRHVAGEIRKWFAETGTPLSIDVLLTRPIDAMVMAIDVARRTKHISNAKAVALNNIVSSLRFSPDTIETINGICRAAMNGRKRGFFKAMITFKQREGR
jgi:hypothetical protein